MNMFQIIFISTITVTTFAISLLTAKIYILALNLSGLSARILLGLGILAPILFVLSMSLSRFLKGAFINSFVYFVDILGGIIFYLFVTGIVLGVMLLLAKCFNFDIPKIVGYVFLSLGFVLAVLGFVQATFIKVTNYEIVLPNAPIEWENKRAVLVSDTHFGLINHKKFSDKVVAKILKINPDFVLHAGDFYDGPDNDTKIISESWQNLTNKIPVFYAPGNHEEYGNYMQFLDSIKNANIKVLVDEVTQYQGVQIAGISYRNKNQIDLADKVLKSLEIDSTKPLILINHPPTFQQSAIEIGTDLMVSGHTHRGQFWPLNYIVRAIYGKYIYGENTDESLTTITTSGVGTAGISMRLFNTPELVVISFKVK